jgi:AcrR family transcriptional regulator
MSTVGPRTLRADAARNRELVLAAAARLLRERGLDVTMQQVADEAGVGVGTVFRRFAGKDELVAAVVQERMGELLALARDAAAASVADPWAAFEAFFLGAAQMHVRHRGFMEAVGGEHVAHPRHDELRVELMVHLRSIVQAAHDAGVLRADVVAEDIPELAWLVSRTSCMPVSEIEPDVWRRPFAIVLDGLRASTATTALEPQMPTYEQIFERMCDAAGSDRPGDNATPCGSPRRR